MNGGEPAGVLPASAIVYVPGAVSASKSSGYTSPARPLQRPSAGPTVPVNTTAELWFSTVNVAPASALVESTYARLGASAR